MLSADFHHLRARKLIALFIVGMSRMTFEPLPGDLLPRGGVIKLSPQVLVLHRLPVNRAPVVGSPAREPFGDALAQVFGIGEDCDLAGLLEHREGREGRLQLHSIVRGRRLTPGEFAHVGPVTKQRRPPARSGVAVTRAVSVDRYLFRAAAFRHANTIPVPAPIRRGFLTAPPGPSSRNNPLPFAARFPYSPPMLLLHSCAGSTSMIPRSESPPLRRCGTETGISIAVGRWRLR